ncbi:EamA family transporter [Bacillus pacificus]
MYGLKIFGLVLGFIGVGVISSSSLTGHISVIGILLALGCAIGWALGTVFIKKTGHRVNAIWMVTIQLLIGGLCLVGFGSEFESWSSIALEYAIC